MHIRNIAFALALPLAALVVSPVITAPAAHAAEQKAQKVHKVVIHVDENNPKKMNLALNNVKNLRKLYDAKGEKIIIEVVTYGPGLHMLRADTSPVKARIERMATEYDNLQFSACANTRRVMKKKSGKEVPLLPEATVVPSGVARIMELQEQGYAYVRP